MDIAGALFAICDAAMRETALFAAAGFLILGAGDLAVDLIWTAIKLRRPRLPRSSAPSAAEKPGALAIFVPAWDESEVIGQMLRHALCTFDHPDYRIYVGCYPNDPATIAAVAALPDSRVRAVVGSRPGPTTKGDCLNRLWTQMCIDEAAEGRRFKAIVLHDAEDVVHSAELRVFDRLIGPFELVQLPVLPLIDRNSRWIAGHYADEFAESHGKELIVRQAIGASLPSAGVGCAIARDALERLAAVRGMPFDPESLTEDYEIGLRLRASGGRAAFVRLRPLEGGPVIATREYFPPTWRSSVSQKSRWMAGIALAGWDRLGWSGGIAERWMRLRDRQAILAACCLFSGYLSFILGAILFARGLIAGKPPAPLSPLLASLLWAGLALLAWRAAMRFGFVTHAYGWREGLRSIPRMLCSNLIAMAAAARAMRRYRATRRTGLTSWEKTVHAFPRQVPAE